MVTGGAFDGSRTSSLRGRPRRRDLELITIYCESVGFIDGTAAARRRRRRRCNRLFDGADA